MATAETGKPRLELEDVDHAYGNVSVLDSVSLAVPSGSVTAMIGPNGSGKTTLATIAAGLRRPTGGDVRLRTTAERPVAFLPQNPRFRPQLTVGETLGFYADLLPTETSPEAALEEVGLDDVPNRRVSALSGGMRRLLGLAQSFLGSPPLIVLDEPTSGLDPRMAARIFSAVSARAADGTAILLTTHDLEFARDVSRVAVLDRGRITVEAPPDELLDRTNEESLREAFLSIVGRAPEVGTGITEDDDA